MQSTDSTTNWSELPSDLTVNILQRVGVIDRLENAQKVCTAWRKIYMDPALWRVIHMDECSDHPFERLVYGEICKHAVDRSQGQLLELTMSGFCSDGLLQYVADSPLKCLEIVHFSDEMRSEAFQKLSSLVELSLVRTKVSQEDIEVVGRCCPLLKTLKVNQKAHTIWGDDDDDDDFTIIRIDIALAIGESLSELTPLELIGSSMNIIGLQAILDGCCHLESLDLRGCMHLDLSGDLGERCSQQIKCLKLPRHSLEGYPHTYDDLDDSDDGYDGYSDKYDRCYDNVNFENMSEMMACMNVFN